MLITDSFVRLRDWLLNRFTGAHRQPVLNARTPGSGAAGVEDLGMGTVLRQAINEVRASAIDDAGARVDYVHLRQSPAFATYRSVAASLQDFDPRTLPDDTHRLAFWINLYNALIIDAVITSDVQVSVRQVPGGVLGFFNRAVYNVGGQRVSAEDIEHGILRLNRGNPFVPGPHFPSRDPRRAWAPERFDPRIHFALNCASASCPPIGVYTASAIDAQLDIATRGFVRAECRLDLARQNLYLSSLFRWYAADFGGYQGILEFLSRYLEPPIHHDDSPASRLRFVYQPYDWSLNITKAA